MEVSSKHTHIQNSIAILGENDAKVARHSTEATVQFETLLCFLWSLLHWLHLCKNCTCAALLKECTNTGVPRKGLNPPKCSDTPGEHLKNAIGTRSKLKFPTGQENVSNSMVF